MDFTPLEAEGFDLKGALGRCMGNSALYAKLLSVFIEDKAFELLKVAMDAGSIQDCFFQAHSLKGMSINMGFTGLYAATCTIVEPLRSGTMCSREDFERVCKEYDKVATAVAACLK